MNALLSIKPEYVEAIRTGKKLFEYRKVVFQKPVSKIVIYSTLPCGMVVGEFSVGKIVVNTPEAIWKLTKGSSGISSSSFSTYFDGRKIAYAIQIENFVEYRHPKKLRDAFPQIKTAPQSFVYV